MRKLYLHDLYKDIPTSTLEDVTLSGWVRTVRDSKMYGFIEINDGTHFKTLQIVVEDGVTADFADSVKIQVGSAIEATGDLVATPGAKQPFELKAKSVTVVGGSDEKYPLQKKRHGFDFLRTIAHLRPRTNTFYAVFSVRSKLAQSIHQFFAERNFNYVHTPIITTSDAEGAGEMFQVTTLDLANIPRLEDGEVDFSEDFFGKKTSLTVSGQLNVEAFCLAFRNVYTFGPTFRSENSNTARHAAEFWMIEPEIAFADLADDMQLAQEMIQYIVADILKKAPDELAFLDKFVENGLIEKLEKLRDAEFARITYTEAIDILEKSGQEFQFKPYWGCDIQTEHERYLSEKHFGGPVFVYNYPKDIKAFYMRLNDDGKTVAAADMLVPGIGELIGGSQREERLDVLESRIREMGMDTEEYWWYLELRRWGGTPHAGFGLGFERMVMYVTGISNIRDVLPYPRCVGQAEF